MRIYFIFINKYKPIKFRKFIIEQTMQQQTILHPITSPYISPPQPYKQPYILQQHKLTYLVRNRRFKKLQQLREKSFFSEEQIKLRHPLLFYLYVGQYEFQQHISQINESNLLLSDFLQKNLVNLEYKEMLRNQLSEEVARGLEIDKNQNEKEIEQIRRMQAKRMINKNIDNKINNNNNNSTHNQTTTAEMQEQQSILFSLSRRLANHIPHQSQIQSLRQSYRQHTTISPFPINPSLYEKPSTIRLSQQELSLQEQHLIEHCEQLFLQGKMRDLFNYEQIDNNRDYDDLVEENKDLEEKYFNEIEEEMEEGQGGYYTGIQDY